MIHLIKYNGRSTQDFGIWLSGEDTWRKPSPDLERTAVPGRNGDLVALNHRYNNIDITYRAGILQDFDLNYSGFVNFLLSSPGYHRLEDSYHPDVYRMALVEADFSPKMTAYNRAGQFDLKFNCKPQTFLKTGDQALVFTADGILFNPTMFDAKPLLRIYGTGNVHIGEEIITVLSIDSYTDIDCESEEAYMDSAEYPRNDKVQISGDDFPVLPPGQTMIHLGAGVSRMEIIPRWWKL